MTALESSVPLHARAADWSAPGDIDRLQRRSLVAGGVGAALSLLGLFLDRPVFFRAYLVSWTFCVGITLGCLAISMLNHLTRGNWGLVVRRVLEAAARTLPVLLLLSLPILFGMKEIYPWARPEVVAGDPILEAKHAYLNVPFFAVRMVLYFLIWGGFATLIDRLSRRQDETGDPRLARRMQLLAGPGLAAYCLAATFAAVDWLMSLQPHWFSTIYGVYFVGGHGLAALAFLIVVAGYLSRRPPLDRVFTADHFQDYGKLFLAFVMLWAYFSFSQFLIIWAGNLPDEIVWYLRRIEHGWGWIALAIVLFHFALPFVLLLSRDLKRKPQLLGAVAIGMLLMRWIDLFWQVEPAFHHGTFSFSWIHLATLLAVGGLWLTAFFAQLKRRPLLPLHDPNLSELLGSSGHE